jgi:hypothetical protein
MHGYNKNKNHYYFVHMPHPLCVIRVKKKKKEQKFKKTMKTIKKEKKTRN